jgi:hypothetical protein
MRIIRTTNPNGTYRYEIDGELHTKASKVLYTHASAWTVGGPEFVGFHKTRAAADKAPGSPRNGWVKTGVIVIEDGDAAAQAPAEQPTYHPRGAQVEYRHAATGQWRPATVTGYRAHQDAYVLATRHGADAAVASDVRTVPATPRKAPRNRAKVRVNDTYPTSTYRGRQGRVQRKAKGDDGNLYVTVDFGNDVTWPFLVSELDLV